ncbi:M23 family metallopeptidase [Pontibacillus yanchengensis]|uniref:Stage II sporulation protein SpoIIQ n=1 Tax=Pontibacillus yanchengensis Y32 TaxID=1385514 RepID=A0A0A2TRB6_9BACI|nr:M23 family metallopeptidase [Pontibacillus yanchengensis]KGP71800.1 Stage II sporulation protein SpoIIQ [Pontibacillus yanchengensis Y32]
MREEENKSVSKNNWKRVFRKKWFFPSVYLITAALLLAGVVWYQNSSTSDQAEQPDATNDTDSIEYSYDGEDSAPVMEQSENLAMPLKEREEVVIKTKFYDYDASQEEKEQALVFYHNRYHQSNGISIAREDGETFDVTASASGTITEVKEDPLFGQLIEISHDSDVTTKYMSLGDVLVEVGAEVKQGDVIATAGQNLAGKDNGVHLDFEVRKGETALNPEEYFNQPLNKLEEAEEPEDQQGQESATEESNEGTGQELNEDDQNRGEDQEQGTDEEDTEQDQEGNDTDQPTEDSESSISMMNT